MTFQQKEDAMSYGLASLFVLGAIVVVALVLFGCARQRYVAAPVYMAPEHVREHWASASPCEAVGLMAAVLEASEMGVIDRDPLTDAGCP